MAIIKTLGGDYKTDKSAVHINDLIRSVVVLGGRFVCVDGYFLNINNIVSIKDEV